MKRIVFVGNCQANALRAVYAAWIAPRRNERVEYVLSYSEAKPEQLRILQEADIIVDQQLSSEQQVEVKRLGLTGKVISFPVVTGIFIWPFHFGEHPHDAVIPTHLTRVFSGWCGDKYLDRAIRAGENPDTILRAYASLDVVNDGRVDRLYEHTKLQQIKRDEQCDIPAWSEISSQLSKSQMFHSPVHPGLRLFHFIADRLFRMMGVSRTQVEDALARCRAVPLPPIETPVHPKVIQHFKMDFLTGYNYYFWFGERISWETYCQRYVDHDWSAPLQYALARSRALDKEPDLPGLLDDLEDAVSRYQAAEGHFAISQVRQRLRDLPGALVAASKAVAQDPTQAVWAAWHAELLRVQGQHEHAETAARSILRHHPGFVLSALLTLIETLSDQGRHDEALLEAENAVSLASGHELAVLLSRISAMKNTDSKRALAVPPQSTRAAQDAG